MNLETTEKIVKDILEVSILSRDNDDILCLRVAEHILGESRARSLNYYDYIIGRELYGIPSTETIRRTRQKLQAKYPELRGAKRVRQKRKEAEEEFRAYAVS